MLQFETLSNSKGLLLWRLPAQQETHCRVECRLDRGVGDVFHAGYESTLSNYVACLTAPFTHCLQLKYQGCRDTLARLSLVPCRAHWTPAPRHTGGNRNISFQHAAALPSVLRLKVQAEKSRLYHTDVIERGVLSGALAFPSCGNTWHQSLRRGIEKRRQFFMGLKLQSKATECGESSGHLPKWVLHGLLTEQMRTHCVP